MRSQGVVVCAIVALTAAVGLWLQWAVLIAIGVGVGVAAVSTLFLRFPTAASWTDVEVPVRVSRNDEGAMRLRIDCSPLAGHWLSAASTETGERAFVANGESSSELSWPIDTSKRGVRLAGPTVLEATDPIGLRRRIFATREQSSVLIVPKVTPLDVSEAFQIGQDETESNTRGPDAFESLREYVTGDPLKLVHWKASARAGELMVRRTVDTHVPRLMVILDVEERSYSRPGSLFRNLDEQAFERAVDLAASVCWFGCTPAQRVLLVTNGTDGSQIDIDTRDRDSALDWLATVQPCDDVAVGNHRLALLARESQPHSVAFVSGPIRHVSRPLIENLQRFVRVVVHRVDPS